MAGWPPTAISGVAIAFVARRAGRRDPGAHSRRLCRIRFACGRRRFPHRRSACRTPGTIGCITYFRGTRRPFERRVARLERSAVAERPREYRKAICGSARARQRRADAEGGGFAVPARAPRPPVVQVETRTRDLGLRGGGRGIRPWKAQCRAVRLYLCSA